MRCPTDRLLRVHVRAIGLTLLVTMALVPLGVDPCQMGCALAATQSVSTSADPPPCHSHARPAFRSGSVRAAFACMQFYLGGAILDLPAWRLETKSLLALNPQSATLTAAIGATLSAAMPNLPPARHSPHSNAPLRI